MIVRLLLIASVIATMASAYPTTQTIYVGEFFQLDFSPVTTISGARNKDLPSWLMYRNNILQGIPTENDVGTHTVKINTKGAKPYQMSIVVTEETEGSCGGEATHWIEVFAEGINDTLVNRVDMAIEMSDGMDKEVKKSLRVYSALYSRQIRTVENLQKIDEPQTFVVLWKAACDNFEDATNVLVNFLDRDDDDNDYIVTLTRGHFSKSTMPRVESSEKTETDLEEEDNLEEDEENEEIEKDVDVLRTTTELVRTTRKVHDNRPILLNRLPSYTCTRGEYCHLELPSETFKDAEDGDTFRLKLSILTLDNAEHWMAITPKGMIGVPMQTGEFSYRLEARDKAGQMASAAFSVIVKPSLPTNHKIQFDMDIPTPDVIASNPQRRTLFINAMSRALKAPTSTFTILEITSNNNNKTIITWSNNTLPYKTCDENGVNTMAAKMIMKQKLRTKQEFVKAMGNQFYVRKATLIRLGNCEENMDVSTTAPTIQSVQEAESQQLILLLILALILLMAIIAIVVYCSCFRRNEKKKAQSTEYVGKGMPVVFPDEVEIEDPAHAGTPMLAREERPPLKVSQHENPLYKPPPPMVSNSPRLGHGSSSQRLPQTFIPP